MSASLTAPTIRHVDTAEPVPKSQTTSVRHLHGPVADFLLLGGSSFLVLPILLALPQVEYRGAIALVTLLLANVINHPHFAHSYQIFYREFGKKLISPDLPLSMRVRFAVAGIIVPIVLILYFGVAVAIGDARLIGLGGNIMALFVGWHYVKQGYGMLMVDAALKRRFFSDPEKKVLLINAYVVWSAAWLYVNDVASKNELWGLQYYSFDVPSWLIACVTFLVAGTTLAAAATFWEKHLSGKSLPLTGVMAYAVTLYLWVLFARLDPLWLLVIPALHSLQYLAVVYRFQTNYQKAKTRNIEVGGVWRKAAASASVQLTLFAVAGLLIGGALFWVIPKSLDASVAYNSDLFGPTLFLFMFWVVVNVHHYFIDSVMWRRDNPETKLHLFA